MFFQRLKSTVRAFYYQLFLILLLILILAGTSFWIGQLLTTFITTETTADRQNPAQVSRPDRTPTEDSDGYIPNISGHTFRDTEQTGTFTTEDRSLSGVRFTLTQIEPERSSPNISWSNTAGWANFTMAYERKNAVIQSPGTYTITALPPRGMRPTTNNSTQDFTAHPLSGSPSGLTLDTMPQPMGFAPKLLLSGKKPHGTALEVLPTQSNTTHNLERIIDTEGSFLYELDAPQELSVIYTKADDQLQREVPAKPIPIVLSTPLALTAHSPIVSSSDTEHFFDFTDLISAIESRKIPTNYHGLLWDNITAMHPKFSEGTGYQNTVSYGQSLAYTSSGQTGTITRDEPFDFVSGYFGAAHSRRDGDTIIVRAYRNNELVHEDTFTLSAYFPTFFLAEYRDITKLTFDTEFAWQIAMDGLTFHY